METGQFRGDDAHAVVTLVKKGTIKDGGRSDSYSPTLFWLELDECGKVNLLNSLMKKTKTERARTPELSSNELTRTTGLSAGWQQRQIGNLTTRCLRRKTHPRFWSAGCSTAAHAL